MFIFCFAIKVLHLFIRLVLVTFLADKLLYVSTNTKNLLKIKKTFV